MASCSALYMPRVPELAFHGPQRAAPRNLLCSGKNFESSPSYIISSLSFLDAQKRYLRFAQSPKVQHPTKRVNETVSGETRAFHQPLRSLKIRGRYVTGRAWHQAWPGVSCVAMLSQSARSVGVISRSRSLWACRLNPLASERAVESRHQTVTSANQPRSRQDASSRQKFFGDSSFNSGSRASQLQWRRQAVKTTDSALEGLRQDFEKPTPTPKDDEEVSGSQKVLCEFILQALFNFLSCSAVAMAVKFSGGNAVVQTLQIMGAHAVILPLVIFAGLEISGAHFNPMVTACFVATGKLPAKLGLGYLGGQLAGGIVGAAAAFSSLPSSMQTLAHAGIQQVPATSTVQQAFMGEIYASFAFIFVLFGTNVDPRGWGKLKPLAVPLIITLLMWLVGPVSSMCINPARAFGPAVVTGFWDHHWIWWTAPFIGGVSAAKIYHSMFLPKSAR